jgi:hypothetical protein
MTSPFNDLKNRFFWREPDQWQETRRWPLPSNDTSINFVNSDTSVLPQTHYFRLLLHKQPDHGQTSVFRQNNRKMD